MKRRAGDKVFWKDPDSDGDCSGVYQIDEIWNAGEADETYLLYNDSSDAEAFAHELIGLENLRAVVPEACFCCGRRDDEREAAVLVEEKFYCAICADVDAPGAKKILRSRTGAAGCFVEIGD